MLDKLFGYKVHSFLHVLGISVLAFGIPFNKVLMSIGAIWGVSNLVLERDFKTYWSNIKKNNSFKWLLAFYALHLIGLCWSSDTASGLHDLKIKLPLLAVPLALTARPIENRNQLHLIFYSLIISLIFTSLLNFGFHKQWFGYKQYTDIRQLSLFGSHIRYGITIALGSGICLYLMFFRKSIIPIFIWAIIFGWFSFYTFYSQILSGILSFVIILIVFILYVTYKYNKYIPVFVVTLTITSIYGMYYYIKPSDKTKISISNLPQKTKEGNRYQHDLKNQNRENNEFVYLTYCDYELEREWSKRSNIPYFKKDLKGQMIRNTLMRYLTSLNKSKDGVGIQQLTTSDILNIENGIASVELLKPGILSRINGIKYQLENDFDPNGHSILQRLEYWKTGINIIQQNWIFGVGTGDVQLAFNQQYEKEKSILLTKNRLRSHNMYITIWITFGILGLVIFMGFIYSYFKFNLQNRELFPLLFISVIVVTFFIEDTLETQMGVSIIALFIGLFMTKIKEDEHSHY